MIFSKPILPYQETSYAEILVTTPSRISEILNGKRGLTIELG